MTFLKFTFRSLDQCMSLKNGINNVQFLVLVQFSSVLMAFVFALGGRLQQQSKFHDILYLPFDNLIFFHAYRLYSLHIFRDSSETRRWGRGMRGAGIHRIRGLACLRNYKTRGKQVVQVVGASVCMHSFVILLLRQWSSDFSYL